MKLADTQTASDASGDYIRNKSYKIFVKCPLATRAWKGDQRELLGKSSDSLCQRFESCRKCNSDITKDVRSHDGFERVR